MTRRFSTVVIVLLSGMTSMVLAQPVTEFETRLQGMKSAIEAIETRVDDIRTNHKIRWSGPQDEIVGNMDRHAAAVKRAFDLAKREVDVYNQSQGAHGDIEALKRFDDTVKDHAARANIVIERLAEIDGGIRDGSIELDGSVIEHLTPQQIHEFRRTLKKEADDKYKEKYPNKFHGNKPVRNQLEEHPFPQVASADGICDSAALQTRGSQGEVSFLGNLMDGLFPPAEGAVAVSCYYVCKTSILSCVSCIYNAGGAAVEAWNSLGTCRGRCCGCHWYAPWCCACRGYCWAVFLAKLA